ncbi:MAG: exosortase E/protease, VPEID-CTERM system [Myxococcota bacterium]
MLRSVLSRAGELGPLAVLSGAAALLLVRARIEAALGGIVSARHPRWPIFLGAQLLAFLGFFLLTRALPTAGPLGIAAWAATLVTLIGAAVLVVVPAAALPALLRALAPLLGLGLGVGALAFAAGKLSTVAWTGLGDATVGFSEVLARWFIPELSREGTLLEAPGFAIEIAPECSGFEGMGLSAVMISAFTWLSRDRLRFPRALLLVPLAVLLAYVANAIRIVALLVVGAYVSEAAAVGGFHSKLGWIMFATVTLGLATFARRSAWFSRDVEEEPGRNETAFYLLPLLVLLGIGFLTGLLAQGLDRLYILRILGSALVSVPAWRTLSWKAKDPLSAIALGVVAFLAWVLLAPSGSGEVLQKSLSALPAPERVAFLSLRVLGSVLVVPLAEELAFRGFLLRRLMRADFEEVPYQHSSWIAVLLSSLAFGVLHQHILGGFLAGVAFALAQRRGGALGDAFLAHATTNGLVAAVVLLFGRYDLWQ